ncbi:hypothetical protein SAMN02745824_1165 [Parasphingorhabdus marina DSM 22363]|uniref:Uncharacterized protein n=1 Tax=Parasphingorhabdus marina DSM 22363 TaxID=1123272 RepID=A0A1N6CWM0_9SPHN|nr:hypothetical protein [Parasphingorhabdus marina]SIN63018.1 hypothetical protein SAMN02745824_1165 [Parasphingorhabdus marina DSM 22363]
MPILPVAMMAAWTLASAAAAPGAVTKPEVIAFGASVADIEKQLTSRCTKMDVRTFDPPRMPIAKNLHQQIDCQGFQFMGEPRLAEFVFADDRLQLVWILVDADDQERIIAAMRETYHSQGLENKMAIAFPEHRTAWRFEPAEVLFYSGEVAPMFEARFGEASSNDAAQPKD